MRCVPARDFSVAKALSWRGAIYDDPPYQRESYVWSLAKQQLFIDSLLNGFDVPKIYLHDLRGRHPTKVYAVVDGKQRLNAIWRFLGDEFPLADDFRVEPANAPPLPTGTTPPRAGSRFSEFRPAWREALRSTFLSVVLIRDATEDDIEDLFARLNSGEPLTAAERRNARGGDMAALVRDVARRPFLAGPGAPGARDHRLELAARLILIEHADPDVQGTVPDLHDRALDEFVEANRRLAPVARSGLVARVDAGLRLLERLFARDDPLLGRHGHVPLYFLFVRLVARRDPEALSTVRDFLARFERECSAQLKRPVARRDQRLAEYGELAAHGANDRRSLARRLEILRAALGAERGVAE